VPGCGYKTSPRPTAATVPEEITVTEVRAYPDRIMVTWPVPDSTSDGTKLKELSGFKVYRAVRDPDEDCENCGPEPAFHVNIDYEKPFNAKIKDGKAIFTDKQVARGATYVYAVSAYNLQGREGRRSKIRMISFGDFPPAPRDLTVSSTSDGPLLTWQASESDSPADAFTVYRGPSSDTRDMMQIGRTDASDTRYTDAGAKEGERYYYIVRSTKMSRDGTIESSPSNLVPFVYRVPSVAAPENVRARRGEDGILVSWDPVVIEGLISRYNVYRSDAGGLFHRVNAAPIVRNRYLDTAVKARTTYRYQVTAFPKSKPESESARSASEAVTF
jgi:fibronectin type 3 domain-containing protein